MNITSIATRDYILISTYLQTPFNMKKTQCLLSIKNEKERKNFLTDFDLILTDKPKNEKYILVAIIVIIYN